MVLYIRLIPIINDLLIHPVVRLLALRLLLDHLNDAVSFGFLREVWVHKLNNVLMVNKELLFHGFQPSLLVPKLQLLIEYFKFG